MGILIVCVEDFDHDLIEPITDGLRARFGGAPITTVLVNGIRPLAGGSGRVLRAQLTLDNFEAQLDQLMNDILTIPDPKPHPEGGSI